MSIYLRDIPLEEAQQRLAEALTSIGMDGLLGVEDLPLDEHVSGRVLAEAIWAKISSPHYHAAAMDGFAVRARDTAGATPSYAVVLKCQAGEGHPVQAKYLDTGDVLPPWADAVIPIEHVEALDMNGNLAEDARRPAAIRIRAAVVPWKHVRTMGEDMVATQLVLPAGHVLRPVDLGAIAACGHTRVRVARKPRVAILPTGTELVSIGQEVKDGEVIEFNSLILAAQVQEWGGLPFRFPIVPDDSRLITEQVARAALTHDLILLNAGSSAGAEDFSAQVVETLGELFVHGVAVRPGHPVILGIISREKARQALAGEEERASLNQSIDKGCVPIVGVPGYPVSATLTGEIFIEPLLSRWLGRAAKTPLEIEAVMTRKITSPLGDDDYVRVAVGKVGENILAAPLARGAGVITSLVRADGIVVLQRGVQGVDAGDKVRVRLYCSPAEIERTLFAIGSHDITLDLMAQFLAEKGRRLVSANVGSLGGLLALKRGEAHLAGAHLLDTQSGEYNLSYIRQYLPGHALKVITLVERQQGLLVARGNPKSIHSLKDLVRNDVRFINRQRGAGTRVLLDYHLALENIDAQHISGYELEEYTHLSVAAAIASGRADCGLGIAAAAQALHLDFIPLFEERYDLIVPSGYYDTPLLMPLWELLQDEAFRAAVMRLPGYNVTKMGELVAEVG